MDGVARDEGDDNFCLARGLVCVIWPQGCFSVAFRAQRELLHLHLSRASTGLHYIDDLTLMIDDWKVTILIQAVRRIETAFPAAHQL
jgi:hypothetical protein